MLNCGNIEIIASLTERKSSRDGTLEKENMQLYGAKV